LKSFWFDGIEKATRATQVEVPVARGGLRRVPQGGRTQVTKVEGPGKASPTADTQVTGRSNLGEASTKLAGPGGSAPLKRVRSSTVSSHAGGEPDMSHPSLVSTPEHKLAAAKATLEHHIKEFHRNAHMSGNVEVDPAQRAQAKAAYEEHKRQGINARKTINKYESAGVKDTERHHAELILHHQQNKDTPLASGSTVQPSRKDLINHHGPMSGSLEHRWSSKIDWENPDVKEQYRSALDKKKTEDTPATRYSHLGVSGPSETTGGGTFGMGSSGPAATEKEKFMQRLADAGKSLQKLLDLVKAAEMRKDYGYGGPGEVERMIAKKPQGLPVLGKDRSEERADKEKRSSEQKKGPLLIKGWALGSNPPTPTNAYQKRELRSDAAHALVNHHLTRIRGDHEQSKQWEDHAKKLSELAGAGPTKKMVQRHIDYHAGEAKTARATADRMKAKIGKPHPHSEWEAKTAGEHHSAAQMASRHPLVKSVDYEVAVPHDRKDKVMVTDKHGTSLHLTTSGHLIHPHTGESHGTYRWQKESGQNYLYFKPRSEDSAFEAGSNTQKLAPGVKPHTPTKKVEKAIRADMISPRRLKPAKQ
jgi:hypothetical protein